MEPLVDLRAAFTYHVSSVIPDSLRVSQGPWDLLTKRSQQKLDIASMPTYRNTSDNGPRSVTRCKVGK